MENDIFPAAPGRDLLHCINLMVPAELQGLAIGTTSAPK